MNNLFKEKRKEKKYTQKELSKLVGLTRSQLANIENNISYPNFKTTLELMILYKITPLELYISYFSKKNNVN